MTDLVKKRYEVPINLAIHLDEEDVEDLVVTALNGGIGYWACLDNTTPVWNDQKEDDCTDEFAAKILMNGGELVFIDEESGDTYTLTMEKLLHGIKRYVELGYDRYNAFTTKPVDMANIDSVCADIIIQFALFDEIVYG